MPKQLNKAAFAEEGNRLKTDGFVEEIIEFNQRIVELSQCDRCRKRELVYHGFSNDTHTLTYGSCACGFWKLFWSEPTAITKTNIKAAVCRKENYGN